MQQRYQFMVMRQRQWMLYILAGFFIGYGFTSFKEVFLGLILGSSLSFFNLWLLQRKVDFVGQAAAKGIRVRMYGSLTRLSSGALAAIIALRYPQYFHMISVVIGLMTAYFVIMIDFALTSIKKRRGT